jgi:hypothetical protein
MILDEFTLNFLVDEDVKSLLIASYWENLYKKTYTNELNDEIINS